MIMYDHRPKSWPKLEKLSSMAKINVHFCEQKDIK